MHRKTVHRWIAVLALVAILGVLGAQPAAAAELPHRRAMDRLASLWSAVTAGPSALWDSLAGWLGGSGTEKSAAVEDDLPVNQTGTWGADPNGNE